MRKGRSSRKSRAPRAVITGTPPAVEAVSGPAGSAQRVVIGLTGPSSSDPPTTARADAEGATAAQAALTPLAPLPKDLVTPAPSEPPPPESEKRIATRPPEEEEIASPASSSSGTASERLAATRTFEREPDAIAGVLHALEHLETDTKKVEDRPAIEPPAPSAASDASIASATEIATAKASADDEWDEKTGAEIIDLKRVIVRPDVADASVEKVESEEEPAAAAAQEAAEEGSSEERALDSEEDSAADSEEEDSDDDESDDEEDVENEASREDSDDADDDEDEDEDDSEDEEDVENEASHEDSDDEEDADGDETSNDEAEDGGEIAAAADETDPDEVSVPPIGDLTVERFFSQGDVSRSLDEPQDELSEKAKRKAAPHVVQRRAKLARYVTWAVGISAVVCLAALARTAVGRSHAADVPPRAAAAVVETPPMPKEAPAPAATVVAEPAKTAEAPPPAETTTAAPAAAEPPAAADAPANAKPEGDAKQEKEASRKALELQKLQDAIDAGERAVALDPTDGEAWLILGVAYQMKGKAADAQRTYKKCLEQAKTRKGECAQFAR